VNRGYKVDLRELHALCEANYARVLRLFPDYEGSNARQFSIAAARIRIDVIERTRYTTVFRLQCLRGPAVDTQPRDVAERGNDTDTTGFKQRDLAWLNPLRIDARAYHDAGMLEVTDFAGFDGAPVASTTHRRVQGRYSYPNPAMHQQDEKLQQNKFLADWLSHCLHFGEAELPIPRAAAGIGGDDEASGDESTATPSGKKPGLKPGAEHA